MVKTFFKSKGKKFCLGAIGAVCALVSTVVYLIVFGLSDEANLAVHWQVFVPSLVAVVAFVVLGLFSVTKKYAPPTLFFGQYVSFLAFILNGYWYLADVFYAGFSFQSFAAMNQGYVFSVVFSLASLVLATIATFTKDFGKGEKA